MTKVKLPDGKGFREMGIVDTNNIPELVIVAEKTSEQTIMELFQKRKQLSPYQLTKMLNRSAGSIYHTLKRMEDRGLLTSRKVEAMVKGVRKTVVVFELKK